MAKSKKIYGWVSEGEFSYPLPSKIKIGTPKQIIRQIEHGWAPLIHDQTKNGTYDQWQNLFETGTIFKQEKIDEDTIALKRISNLELLKAANDERAEVDLKELRDIAEDTSEKISKIADVIYCTYSVRARYWQQTLSLSNGYANPVVWEGDKVHIVVNAKPQEVYDIRDKFVYPAEFDLRIYDNDYSISKGSRDEKEKTTIEFYRHHHFEVMDEEIFDWEDMKPYIQEHNEIRGKSSKAPKLFDLNDPTPFKIFGDLFSPS